MTLDFKCPTCATTFDATGAQIGTPVDCECGALLIVPGPSGTAAIPKITGTKFCCPECRQYDSIDQDVTDQLKVQCPQSSFKFLVCNTVACGTVPLACPHCEKRYTIEVPDEPETVECNVCEREFLVPATTVIVPRVGKLTRVVHARITADVIAELNAKAELKPPRARTPPHTVMPREKAVLSDPLVVGTLGVMFPVIFGFLVIDPVLALFFGIIGGIGVIVIASIVNHKATEIYKEQLAEYTIVRREKRREFFKKHKARMAAFENASITCLEYAADTDTAERHSGTT